MRVLEWILVAFVLAATLPPIAGVYQFVLAGLHRFHRDPLQLTGRPPRVAVVIPAWNEAAVILRTIEYLLALDYPSGQLRIYVVDDASTDETPEIVETWSGHTPGSCTTSGARAAARARRTRSTSACARSAPTAGTRRSW